MIQENNMIPVSVDPVVFTMHNNVLHVLLMKRKAGPFADFWSFPGGLMQREDNSIKDAIARVLNEKTKMKTNYLEQLHTRTGHDPRGPTVSISYVCLTDYKETTGDVQWFSVDEAKKMTLAFDHNSVLLQSVERLLTKINYSTLPVYFLPETFTLPELYKIYNVLLDGGKSNSRFRSKIDEVGGVVNTGETRHRGAARPAALYRASEDSPKFFNSNYIR
jgi:hypothetical protein